MSMIDHPEHYNVGGIEAIDVIEAYGLGFALGNCIKYILRAGRKGDYIEDLHKARWYLDREIASAGAFWPKHYSSVVMDVTGVIEAYGLSPATGDCVEYILCAGRGVGYMENLRKARRCLDREIAKTEKDGGE